jgi:hypothetical protein
MLSALYKYNTLPSTPTSKRVPVPEPIILCEDSSVIGTPFYIMEFLDGRIFQDARMLQLAPQDRKEWCGNPLHALRSDAEVSFVYSWLSAVKALTNLGAVVPADVGLSDFGPTTDYFPRQIKSLTRISLAQSEVADVETKKPVGKIPYYDKLISWYESHLPDESKMGLRIVHGDYKLDNLIFHPTENRVIGILDWELCTLGSPVCISLLSFLCRHPRNCSACRPGKSDATMVDRQKGPTRQCHLCKLATDSALQECQGHTYRGRRFGERVLPSDAPALPYRRYHFC